MSPQPTDKRERDIRLWWERDPNGPILPRDRAPPGLRTPNGFVWGHQVGHIFWIQRIPGANALTVWSRSMIKAHGEGYDDDEWDEPLVEPRVIRPWPVLRLRTNHGSSVLLNPPDRGCKSEHSKKIVPPEGWVRADASAVMSPGILALFGECPLDPLEICTGPLLPNVGSERLKDSDGEFYDYVWCEHFKEKIDSVNDPERFFAIAIAMTGHAQYVPDAVGVCIYTPPNTGEDGGPSKAASDVAMTDSAGASSEKGAAAQARCDATSAEAAESKSESKSESEEPVKEPTRGQFSVKDLPKLEEFIPEELLPDVLMVHDPDNTTFSWKTKKGGKKQEPIKYKRFYPTPSIPEDEAGSAAPREEKVAHLYLNKSNRFGSGNHSYVYRAPLTLPPPLSASSPTGQVTVAAKLSYNRCTAHELLHNEARVYDSLPKHTQEDWCGYNVVPQCRFPVPVSAIAPKFFGYYLPVDESGKVRQNRHPTCTEEHPCTVEWPSPILLMEECGNPVEPSKFTTDQRTECFSLILRLHHMDIVQGSFYVRNIMIQPGPLSVPPEKRSYDQPSFRIIDFGRGKCWDWELEQADVETRKFDFARRVGDEVARARHELLIEDFGF